MLSSIAGFILSAVVAGAVGAVGAIATVLWTSIGDRWIASRFARALESHKSGLQKEVEQLKARLSHFTDRGVRANQLEYEALTAAWIQYVKAHDATLQCIIRFSSRPDMNTLNDEQLNRYLDTTDFSDQQKEQVRGAANKNDMFGKIETMRIIAVAGNEIFKARGILGDNAIFIPTELEDDFSGALDKCAKAWAAERTKFSLPEVPGADNSGLNNMILEFVNEQKSIRDNLKAKVRRRILAPYSSEA